MERIFAGVACLLLLAGIWPVLAVANRIYPFVLGLPFFIFWMLLLDVLVTVLLCIALRKLE